MSSTPDQPGVRAATLLLFTLGVLLFGVRLAGPPDLTDNDQEGPTAYILDVLQNGHWAVQRDAHGEIASKPPLYTWLAALTALAGGGLNRFTLYFPCALAVIGTALLVLRIGAGRFGVVAGLIAGFSILFSQFGLKHVALARTDAVFMATVTLGAVAALRAWETGRGWTRFWLGAAAASLTKGPLGILLAAGGLLAAGWGRRNPLAGGADGHVPGGSARLGAGGQPDDPPPLAWRRSLPGAVVCLALVGGWFGLAYLAAGDALLEKQIGRELVGHLSGASAGGHWPGSSPLHPIAYFLSRYAPWSLLACVGFWRVCRRPAAAAAERRLERFLFCWFFVGLGVFIIAPHKRADLLLPMIPAAALLAGREAATWLRKVRPVVVWRWVGALGLAIVASLPALSRLKTEAPEAAAQSLAMQQMGDWIHRHVPPEIPVTFAGNLMTLQFYLNRHQFLTTPEQAARLLQSGTASVVAVADAEALERLVPAGTPWHILGREPAAGSARVHLVSNRPGFVTEPGWAVAVGVLGLELTDAQLIRAHWYNLDLQARKPGAQVRVHNSAPHPVSVGVCWLGEATVVRREHTIPAGGTWTMGAGG